MLLAAIFIISDYIETAEAELDYKQSLINELVKENTEYRRIADKKNNADRTYWG